MQILANLGYRRKKKSKPQTWTNMTTLWEPDGLILSRWAVYGHIYGISLGMCQECCSLVGGGGGRSHGTCVHMWTTAHWDLLCMLYLIVISANRKREAHQQAMPGSQWLGEAHVDDLIGTCWRGALPLLKKSTNWINIESAEKISVCWKKQNYS